MKEACITALVVSFAHAPINALSGSVPEAFYAHLALGALVLTLLKIDTCRLIGHRYRRREFGAVVVHRCRRCGDHLAAV